ncbi:hypothetical protein MLD38_022365 [Melastoma candidum]|uniref:Uncharacterized protein n=1 Tax=Melastoma candidum TaxID=119954 RepID=A0ACB9QIW7_9MYRT|nr:hypothetical protein MLD38_022365 [Melastoma candidum]
MESSAKNNGGGSSSSSSKKWSKVVHVITFPARILAKARDIYVSTLTTCSSRVAHPYVFCPRHDLLPLHRSFSSGGPSSRFKGYDDDFMELVRAASIRTLSRDDRYVPSLREKVPPGVTEVRGGILPLPKSCSLVMGRIDEDKAFDEAGSDASCGTVDGGGHVRNMNGVGLRYKSRSFSAGNRSSLF